MRNEWNKSNNLHWIQSNGSRQQHSFNNKNCFKRPDLSRHPLLFSPIARNLVIFHAISLCSALQYKRTQFQSNGQHNQMNPGQKCSAGWWKKFRLLTCKSNLLHPIHSSEMLPTKRTTISFIIFNYSFWTVEEREFKWVFERMERMELR